MMTAVETKDRNQRDPTLGSGATIVCGKALQLNAATLLADRDRSKTHVIVVRELEEPSVPRGAWASLSW
jgi:hypothetical protein